MARFLGRQHIPKRPPSINTEKRLLIQQLQNPDTQKLFFQMNNQPEEQEDLKSEEKSRAFRAEAREAFTDEEQKHDALLHRKIWTSLTLALASAPFDSIEYVLALDARSRFLMHLNLHRECERDVDRALNILDRRKDLYIFKCELILRKMQCWVKLSKRFPSVLSRQFREYLLKISESEKEEIVHLLRKLNELSAQNQKCNNDGHQSYRFDGDQRIRLPPPESQKVSCGDNPFVVQKHQSRGWFTMAAREFKTGDIICAEDIYAAMPLPGDHMNCNHCLARSWTLIPCYECRLLYCSEKCRDKATTKYHYYECKLYRLELGSKFCQERMNEYVKLGLRLFLMALIECGSNEKLLKKISRVSYKDLPKRQGDETTDRFEHYFALGIQIKANISMINSSIMTLIAAAKHCNLFRNSFYELQKVEDLIADKQALKIGALILRYSEIALYYSQNITEPNIQMWVDKKQRLHCVGDSKCIRARIIAPLSSYFNHSCYPNVARICNDEGQVVIYATRPIYVADEVVACHDMPYYSNTPRDHRQARIFDKYGFYCECKACQNNWPSIPIRGVNGTEHIIFDPEISRKIYDSTCQGLEHISDESRHRAIRDKVAVSIDSILTMFVSEMNHEAIGLVYMLNLGFQREMGAVSYEMPIECNRSKSTKRKRNEDNQ